MDTLVLIAEWARTAGAVATAVGVVVKVVQELRARKLPAGDRVARRHNRVAGRRRARG
jgi:hypothetical protein